MKKFLFVLLLAIPMCVNAQHTISREAANSVTNASVISFVTTTIVDTAGSTKDTVNIRPRNKVTYYHINLADSAIINLKSTASCYYGDIIYMDIVNPAFTNKLVLGSYFIMSTGTTSLALTASKSSQLKFWFNGSDFVEESRLLNYTR